MGLDGFWTKLRTNEIPEEGARILHKVRYWIWGRLDGVKVEASITDETYL
jgi:hypothetical protein